MSRSNIADERDRIYSEGCNSVYREFLMAACRGLGRPSTAPDATPDQLRARIAVLEAERSAAISKLREVCAEHGDAGFTDDLYLPDIIDNHLARYLGDE